MPHTEHKTVFLSMFVECIGLSEIEIAILNLQPRFATGIHNFEQLYLSNLHFKSGRLKPRFIWNKAH